MCAVQYGRTKLLRSYKHTCSVMRMLLLSEENQLINLLINLPINLLITLLNHVNNHVNNHAIHMIEIYKKR